MKQNLIRLTAGIMLLGVSVACAMPQQHENTLTTTQTALLTRDNSQADKPPTKTATITVEGEKVPVQLRLYKYSNLLTTYFPEKDFLVTESSSGEGSSVRFIANFGGQKNENAYVHFAFLNNLKTLGQVRNFVNGKNGLIASNKWRVVSRSNNVKYPWAKEKIVFSQGKNIVGAVYIGEQKGKAFYVITHLPVEYGDGFSPRADLILKNIKIGR